MVDSGTWEDGFATCDRVSPLFEALPVPRERSRREKRAPYPSLLWEETHENAKLAALLMLASSMIAGRPHGRSHTWRFARRSQRGWNDSIIELRESGVDRRESFACHLFRAIQKLHDWRIHLAMPTTFRRLLFATPAFAASPAPPHPTTFFLLGWFLFSRVNDTLASAAGLDDLH